MFDGAKGSVLNEEIKLNGESTGSANVACRRHKTEFNLELKRGAQRQV